MTSLPTPSDNFFDAVAVKMQRAGFLKPGIDTKGLLKTLLDGQSVPADVGYEIRDVVINRLLRNNRNYDDAKELEAIEYFAARLHRNGRHGNCFVKNISGSELSLIINQVISELHLNKESETQVGRVTRQDRPWSSWSSSGIVY